MPIAAIPAYLGKDFKEASPGLRFGAYLNIWNDDWSKPKSIDRQTWQAIARLNDCDKKSVSALLARQRTAFAASGPQANRFSLEAQSIAPFATGLGNEHPLENGFAFLNPYGLPYLPGSGIKGVLRQAACELASGEWGDKLGWTDERIHPVKVGRDTVDLSPIDALFGRKSVNGDTHHVRGALTFWDVIPQIKGDALAVDIMTPHQSHYYQQKRDPKAGNSDAPHDSGQPNPIHFLTVPAGSGFSFHVGCDLAHLEHLAPDLAHNDRWKTLLSVAFKHAFQWLGFGAKTSVGYGAMEEDPAARKRREEEHKAAQDAERKGRELKEREQSLAAMNPAMRAAQEFLDARVDKNQPELSALLGGLKKGFWSGDAKSEIAQHIKELMLKDEKWIEKSNKKNPAKDFDHQDTLDVMKCLPP